MFPGITRMSWTSVGRRGFAWPCLAAWRPAPLITLGLPLLSPLVRQVSEAYDVLSDPQKRQVRASSTCGGSSAGALGVGACLSVPTMQGLCLQRRLGRGETLPALNNRQLTGTGPAGWVCAALRCAARKPPSAAAPPGRLASPTPLPHTHPQIFDAYGEEGLKGGAPPPGTPDGAAGSFAGFGGGGGGGAYHGVDDETARKVGWCGGGRGGGGGGGPNRQAGDVREVLAGRVVGF